MFQFPIVDPHVHQWDVARTPRVLTWPKRLLGWNPRLYESLLKLAAKEADRHYVGRVDYVAYDYLPVHYSMDADRLPISHVVHVEAHWQDKSALGPVGETRWLEEIFQDSPVALGAIVGQIPLQHPRAEAVLKAHLQASARFRGVRQMLAFDSDPGIMNFCPRAELSRDPQWRSGLSLLAPHNLSFDAWMFHHQLPELLELAQAFPRQTFVLNHLGTPIGIGGPFASYGRTAEARQVTLRTWQMHLQALAEQPNVMVKLSGLFMPVLGWGFEHRSRAPGLQELLDKAGPLIEFGLQQFGVERCLFASNFPMDKVSLSLPQLYEFYAAVVAGYAESDRRKLFYDNAARLYGIGGTL
ncbi:MAG: amidohydrolase [Pseudomonadales bacterium]|nr:amidohydrolase [Pseudomonadales bacterium]